jgi:pimeloyl-ACP methyl ester carboxylesterase
MIGDAGVQQRRIETRVGPLAVRIREARPGLPTAVLWHSLFVDSRSWGRVEEDLGAERRLVEIDGPGHGGSGDSGRRYTLGDCAAAACEVLDALGVTEPVDWVGNAWGGHVGIVVASRWPDRIRTLVTVGTPVHGYGRKGRVETGLLLVLHRVMGPSRFLQKAVTDVLLSTRTRTHDHDAVALVGTTFADADPAAMRNAVVSISLRRPDLSDLLPRVEIPTLFVTSPEHQEWPPERARAAAALLPRGSVEVVPDAAYLTPLETPAELATLLRRHWAA